MLFKIKAGVKILYQDTEHEIASEPTSLDKLMLRNLRTGKVYAAPYHALTLPEDSGEVVAYEQLLPKESLTEKQLKQIDSRFEVIKPLLDVIGDKEAVRKAAFANSIGVSTIYRWLAKYVTTENKAALADADGRGGKGKPRINDKTSSVLINVIDKEFLNGKSFSYTYNEIERLCKQRKYAVPSENTVRNFIKRISQQVKISRRQGPKTAKQIYEPVTGKSHESIAPLHWCEMDHTIADIMLVDELTRKVIGRPWVTVVIDVYSRAILGFFCSFFAPGSYGTGRAIVHAIMPKESWLSSMDLSVDMWPIWGKMKNLRCDNAGEFKGNSIKQASSFYGIDFEFRAPGKPQHGCYIERFLGTFAQKLKDVKGSTNVSKEMRHLFKPEKMASLTLKDFEKWMTLMIIRYNNELHSGIGMTPMQKYNYGLFNEETGIGIPERYLNDKRLKHDFLPFVKRNIIRTGVKINNVFYYSDAFLKYIDMRDEDQPGRPKKKFIFKVDPRDISEIYFLNPDLKQYFAIQLKNHSEKNFSLVELNRVIGIVKKNGKKVTEQLIFETYALQKKLEDDASKKTKHQMKVNTVKAAIKQEKEGGDNKKQTSPTHRPKSNFSIDISDIKPFKVYDNRKAFK